MLHASIQQKSNDDDAIKMYLLDWFFGVFMALTKNSIIQVGEYKMIVMYVWFSVFE